jgi:DNA polymerase (family 10)
MPSNAEAAGVLRSIADLLDLTGERFKPEAYRRAARSIETLPEPLERYASRGQLRDIPGVGEAIAEKMAEYLRTGHIAYHDRLQKEIPAGVLTIMRLPGLGPKTARRLWTDLGIEGPTALRDAIDAGRLSAVKGFGPRKIEIFRQAVAVEAPPASQRIPIVEAYAIAQRLLTEIKPTLTGEERAEAAGSLRRGRETVGDLDLLVSSLRPREIFDAAARLPEVAQIVLRGDTKMTVRLRSSLQVDLRVVEPESFGSALVYFTGSKDHNIRIRTLARDRGLKINEYGVYRGDERIAGHTEVDVYRALGLPWIPPEIREDRGEVDAARRGELPLLVGANDLKGELHWHVPPDASVRDVDAILAEARRRRFEYIGAVVEGVGEDGREARLTKEVRECLERRRERHRPGEPYVWLVAEVTPKGRKRPFTGVDYLALRADPSVAPTRPTRTASAPVRLIAHAGGTTDRSDHRSAWIALACEENLGVEVASTGNGLDSDAAREARERGAALVVSTGLAGPDAPPTGPVSLAWARRAWVSASQVVNCRSYRELSRTGGARTSFDAENPPGGGAGQSTRP